MKASQDGWPILGMLLMYVLLALSYFTLSKAVLRLPVGVAYAFWEGAGLALIVLISFVLLGESLGPLRIAALCMVFLGTYLVHRGTSSSHEEAAG